MLETDPRAFVDPFVSPVIVEIPQDTSLQVHFDLADRLRSSGATNICHFGGSLRDTFARVQPRDYDIQLQYPEILGGYAEIEAEAFLDIVSQQLHTHIRLEENLAYMEVFNLLNPPPILSANINGNECNLIITPESLTAEEIATRGDAPVNCFAMSDEEKVIFAHPDAVKDLEAGQYRIRVCDELQFERSVNRFLDIGKRYRASTGKGFTMGFSPTRS